ncbi:hypothetical protein [Cohnella sp. AR92]|uniref:hypothetical protein n=1 Tax=Cohnella sp. AR92 TaxID=648716 RepID=UPI000F8F5E54|nr:hypothetical protein [Cohnella sp. AR92]RUS46978.1 hypothetical protein ELR57_11270 [Cohnella sp. AR92]
MLIFPISSTHAASLYDHQDTTVPAGQTVVDVVVVGGDVTVAGSVSNSVVVVNGDVNVSSTARIKGVIVVIGGHLHQEEGADVTNDIVSISFDNATVNSLIIGTGLILGLGAFKLAASLILFIVPILMVAIGRRRTAAVVDRFRNSPRGKLFAAGFFVGLLIFAVSVVLLLTIVGIPFILIFALFLFIALGIGITIVSQTIGEQIRIFEDKPEWARAGAGAMLLVSMLNVPFIGMLLFLALTLFSLGVSTSLTVSLLRNRKRPLNGSDTDR